MPGERTIDERLRAVERAVTDEEVAVADVADAAALTDRLETLEARVSRCESRTDEIEAAVTALRGYVGELSAVNDDVERTAAAALAGVERLSEASGAPPAIARVAGDEPAMPDPVPDSEGDASAPRSLRDRLEGLL